MTPPKEQDEDVCAFLSLSTSSQSVSLFFIIWWTLGNPACSWLLICRTVTGPCGNTNMPDYAIDYSAIFRRKSSRLMPAPAEVKTTIWWCRAESQAQWWRRYLNPSVKSVEKLFFHWLHFIKMCWCIKSTRVNVNASAMEETKSPQTFVVKIRTLSMTKTLLTEWLQVIESLQDFSFLSHSGLWSVHKSFWSARAL